jgi:hypothetical protein
MLAPSTTTCRQQQSHEVWQTADAWRGRRGKVEAAPTSAQMDRSSTLSSSKTSLSPMSLGRLRYLLVSLCDPETFMFTGNDYDYICIIRQVLSAKAKVCSTIVGLLPLLAGTEDYRTGSCTNVCDTRPPIGGLSVKRARAHIALCEAFDPDLSPVKIGLPRTGVRP